MRSYEQTLVDGFNSDVGELENNFGNLPSSWRSALEVPFTGFGQKTDGSFGRSSRVLFSLLRFRVQFYVNLLDTGSIYLRRNFFRYERSLTSCFEIV